MKIKIESWSHCAGEWMFFDYFNSKEDADKYLTSKGYDLRYFRESITP